MFEISSNQKGRKKKPLLNPLEFSFKFSEVNYNIYTLQDLSIHNSQRLDVADDFFFFIPIVPFDPLEKRLHQEEY